MLQLFKHSTQQGDSLRSEQMMSDDVGAKDDIKWHLKI